MDGLLIDSELLYQRAWQAAARELGFEISDHTYLGMVGLPENACESAVLTELGEAFPLSRFRELWKRNWLDRVEVGELLPKAGARRLLEKLRDAEVPVALATSSTVPYTTVSLQRTGLDCFFEIIVTAEDAPRGKPSPDIYEVAATRLGVDPCRCLVLEDSPAGAAAGLAAGMAVIIVPDLQPPPPHCAEQAMGVFSSLGEATPIVLRALRRDSQRT